MHPNINQIMHAARSRKSKSGVLHYEFLYGRKCRSLLHWDEEPDLPSLRLCATSRWWQWVVSSDFDLPSVIVRSTRTLRNLEVQLWIEELWFWVVIKFRGRNFSKLGRVVTPRILTFGFEPHTWLDLYLDAYLNLWFYDICVICAWDRLNLCIWEFMHGMW